MASPVLFWRTIARTLLGGKDNDAQRPERLFVMRKGLLECVIGHFTSVCRSAVILLVVSVANASAATVIDVRSHGALPDDASDDSVAIQKAIDTAPDGSTIYFPRGTYLLAGVRINNRNGLTLSGDGSTLSILRRSGSYPKLFESSNAADMLITKLGFDTNGLDAYGGFNFYNARHIVITKTHFFDSNKQPVGGYDRYAWVFGRGSAPSEDILISDNLIEDLQLEVDFGLRVRIEGNTIIRPVATAGIGVFTVNDNTAAQEYTIQKNTIVDPVVSAGGIVLYLDPSSNNYSTMKSFRILENQIVYTQRIVGSHASAIRLGTGNNSQATTGNTFDDIAIQNNVVYKDPGTVYDFGAVDAIIFGNSSATANFKFNNANVSDNRVYYNNRWATPIVDIREKGVNYVESNNREYSISSDIMPPSVPTALTTGHISGTEINLAWNTAVDNVGVYRYRVYRNGIAISYSATRFYADKNLLSGATYTYTVTAIDGAGNESGQSLAATATTTAIGTISTRGRGHSKRAAMQ